MVLPLTPPYLGLEFVWLPMVLKLDEPLLLVGVIFFAFLAVKAQFAQLVFGFKSIERKHFVPTPLRLWWVVLQSLLFFFLRQFTVSAVALTLRLSSFLSLALSLALAFGLLVF